MASVLLLSTCITLGSPVIPVAHAFRDGAIAVKACSFSGHSLALLEIRNKRAEPLTVDLNGSYLIPGGDSIQRLGLGLVRAGDRNTSVKLAASAKISLKVLSVCMDSSKSSPASATPYELAKELAPEETLQVLREWRAHPTTPQVEIQSAVWHCRRPKVVRQTDAWGSFPDAIEQVMWIDHRLLIRTRDGQAFFGPAGSPLAPLPGTVQHLWASKEAYALREEPAAEPRSVVSRFKADTSDWSDLPLPGVSGRLKWVAEDEREAVILTAAGAVVRAEPGSSVTVAEEACLAEVSSAGSVYWVPASDRKALLWTELKGKAPRRIDHDVPILKLVWAGDALFFLDAKRSLIRFGGRKPRRLHGEVILVDRVGDRLLVGTRGEPGRQPAGKLHFHGAGLECLPSEIPYPDEPVVGYILDAAAEELFCTDLKLRLKRYDKQANEWLLAAILVAKEPRAD